MIARVASEGLTRRVELQADEHSEESLCHKGQLRMACLDEWRLLFLFLDGAGHYAF